MHIISIVLTLSTLSAVADESPIVPDGARLEKLWGEGEFTEGPAQGPDGRIYFSDIGNRIMAFDPGTGRTTIFRNPSGRANGLDFDPQGRLVVAEGANTGGNRRITRTEKDGTVRVLADRWRGKRFNSPNDLTIDAQGRIYFTDPRYVGDEPRELPTESVYRIDPDGMVSQVITDVQKPNGIALSPNMKTLYLADNNPQGNRHLLAYALSADGTIGPKRILHDFGKGRGIDGMSMDVQGNIYATAGSGAEAGVYVFSPEGKRLAFIPTPEDPSNCVFGGKDRKTLYVTAGKSLYRIHLKIAGFAVFWPEPAQEKPGLPGLEAPGQPVAANARRVLDALELLGQPLEPELTRRVLAAATDEDASRLQELLDPRVFCLVTINPESRIKVERGPIEARLQQGGFVPLLVKVVNQGVVKAPLRIFSPQAGPPYAGVTPLSMARQDQPVLRENENRPGAPRRFLQVEMFAQPPLNPTLSGLHVEYVLALIYCSDAGRREATLGFDVGQGTQDLGFRGEVPVLFDVQPAIPVRLSIRDHDGRPGYARLTIRDKAGQVYPPQARRLAPDLFFQKQIYRRDGEIALLPPGELVVECSRGPEYRVQRRSIQVQAGIDRPLELRLERWVNPMTYGFFCGDHHIHGAGCAHYTSPTEGMTPQDMFRQVAGEGLNVGCVLTWGPCYDYQRRFFSPGVSEISEPLTVMKYDVEISGFGSQALGHVCLLNLRDQTYPGSNGTKEKGWPTWATPALRWAKAQGAVTGFAHSASGLQVNPQAAAKRLLAQLDLDRSGQLSPAEARAGLLPKDFADLDADADGFLSEAELRQGIDRAADELPSLAVPEMNSVGAMELPVAVAAGVCDFISAMDTARLPEWNMWYHVMNCGFPLKVSGETDFPCMSSMAVGQGRVYVQMGVTQRVDFGIWCANLAAGKSYISDGYAHALQFTVNDASAGASIRVAEPVVAVIKARLAFAPETPESVGYGTRHPEGGRRWIGDTVTLHGSRSERLLPGGTRLVEIVVNGKPVASQQVPADGREHDLEFRVPVARSSWVALRQFPQLHTNPVDVLVAGKPIRASRDSARWCEETIHQLWRVKSRNIAAAERGDAEKAFQAAIAEYRRRGAEAHGEKAGARLPERKREISEPSSRWARRD